MVTSMTNGHATADVAETKKRTFDGIEELTLPSGVTVEVVRVDGMDLIEYGADIGVMQALAAKLTTEANARKPGEPEPTLIEMLSKDAEARDGFTALLNAYTRACLVRPVVVDRREDVRDPERQVWIRQIASSDKQAIMDWAQGSGVANKVAAFPDEAGEGGALGQDASVDAVPNRNRARRKAE